MSYLTRLEKSVIRGKTKSEKRIKKEKANIKEYNKTLKNIRKAKQKQYSRGDFV